MKIKSIAFLLFLSFVIPLSSASPEVISINTGSLDFSGVIVRISYSVRTPISPPSFALSAPPRPTTWTATLYGEWMSISVYVPTPISRWFNRSLSVPIGSHIDIPLYSTGFFYSISARIKLVANASVSTTSAYTNVQSLSWDSEGAKTFTVYGETTTLGYAHAFLDYSFKISLGLVISLVGFEFTLAETDIGTFPANSRVGASMLIVSLSFLVILVSLLFLLIVALISLAYKKHKRKAEPPSPPPILKHPIVRKYCIHCGEKLPSEAVYCSKCGEKTK